MLVIFLRTILLYILVLVVMRLMGKREIGQLQPFELAISIMIADLASIPMADTGIPISNGIVPILGLLVMHLVISMINMKSMKVRGVLCGKPTILIYRGRIDEKALKKERFTLNELQERLRGNNIVNLGDVEYAILETSGQVTIIQKPNKRTTTPEDFNIMPEYEGIPYDLIVDGKIMKENLKQINKDEEWLKKQVSKFHIDVADALIVTYDGKGQIFCQEKENKKKGA
ncbi:MAG: DUF421 domain-containing protein [Clostridia bacterium]|jgi:uncharacterized membrane protein YcaP (DUF421 family)|nr:DUF421 domain-containing protein [Clostridia bacterium]